MSDHASRTVQRYCDVAVVGGSAAGLAAAIQLGRQRRSVIVVEDRQPRNAASAHMHGYLGRDGAAPAELLAAGREEVRSYGGEVLGVRADRVTATDDARFCFRVDLAGGHAVFARRVLAATGVVDELPDIAGLAQHWGRDAIHCPFCHGYEFRDRRIVQIVTHPAGLHVVGLFRQLTERLTVLVADSTGVDDGQLETLRSAGVDVRRGAASRLVAGADGHLIAVELLDHDRLDADAVAVMPRFRARVEPFAPLGLRLAPHPNGLGDAVDADPTGETAIPGLYAAGSVTDPSQQVLPAAAAGSRAGAAISVRLAEEDARAASRASANEADWENRYAGPQMWSGNPNGTLVDEVRELPPGRALDVGAGEGGDAIWLAEQGWRVTASDISQHALNRVAAEAERRGLDVECVRTDANALDPYEPAAFDLVSAQYASIPRTPDDRGVRNLLGAVAPGGVLLVVSHDLEPMAPAHGGAGHGRPFDPDAYQRVEDFIAALAASPEWAIEVHETRDRPPGSATASEHVRDVVLLARRSPADRPAP